MAVTFVNVKSREKLTLSSTAQIAAFFNSSNLNINANKGQDFGWRLSPELVIEIKRIRKDFKTLKSIAEEQGTHPSELTDVNIVWYLSSQDDLEKQLAAQNGGNDFSDEYEAEIKALENGGAVKEDSPEEALTAADFAPKTATTSTPVEKANVVKEKATPVKGEAKTATSPAARTKK